MLLSGGACLLLEPLPQASRVGDFQRMFAREREFFDLLCQVWVVGQQIHAGHFDAEIARESGPESIQAHQRLLASFLAAAIRQGERLEVMGELFPGCADVAQDTG